MNIKIGPVPLITIAGAFSFAISLFCLIIFLHCKQPGLLVSRLKAARKARSTSPLQPITTAG